MTLDALELWNMSLRLRGLSLLCLHVPWSAGGREGEQVDVRGPVSVRVPCCPCAPGGRAGWA